MKLVGKLPHFSRLGSFGTGQSEGQAYHNLNHFIFRQHGAQSFPVAPFVLTLDGIEALGGNAKRVGNSDPNSSCTHIEPQNAAARGDCGWLHLLIVDA